MQHTLCVLHFLPASSSVTSLMPSPTALLIHCDHCDVSSKLATVCLHLESAVPAAGQLITFFAEQGLVFGVGTDKGVIKLFDVRSYAQGPFDAFTVSSCFTSAPKLEWHNMIAQVRPAACCCFFSRSVQFRINPATHTVGCMKHSHSWQLFGRQACCQAWRRIWLLVHVSALMPTQQAMSPVMSIQQAMVEHRIILM